MVKRKRNKTYLLTGKHGNEKLMTQIFHLFFQGSIIVHLFQHVFYLSRSNDEWIYFAPNVMAQSGNKSDVIVVASFSSNGAIFLQIKITFLLRMMYKYLFCVMKKSC